MSAHLLPTMPPAADDLLAPLPLAPTLTALRSGALALTDHVAQQCARIERVDPVVQSLLPEPHRREWLLAEAALLQASFATPAARPPLYGALVGVKDIFHVDGVVTRAGTAVPPEEFAGSEAAVVRALRDAGALIAGKTVTTEFAYFEPGPTVNPHRPTHTPGGSSSGSAAAVAAGLLPLAVGTQTIGSVIRPAAFCGIVGFKPTLHRIPSAGLVYFSPTIDHVGLFTQDVAGMAQAAGALCAAWRGLPAAQSAVLGVPDGPFLQQTEPEALARFEAQIARLPAAGFTLQRVPIFADIAELNQLHRRLVFAEFARGHTAIYERHAARYRPRTREIIELGRQVGDDELTRLRERALEARERMHSLMAREGIDGWLCPAAPGPAPAGLGATGDPNLNLPWTHMGMPALTVPAGVAANGLPLGLQLVGRYGEDEQLLAWALAVEPLFAARAQ